jgi:hypothetical protein
VTTVSVLALPTVHSAGKNTDSTNLPERHANNKDCSRSKSEHSGIQTVAANEHEH